MSGWVSIDGQITAAAEARVSVFDRGFLFGDSVYEVLRTVDGTPLFWTEHMERLWRSAGFLHLPIGCSSETLREELDALLARSEGEQLARIIVTRGSGSMGLDLADAGSPCRVIITKPLIAPDPALRQRGIALAIVASGRRGKGDLDPRAKCGSRLQAVMAVAEARRGGAHEALMVDPLGRILEGATSTFFLVKQGALCTPPLGAGILEGITRRHVLACAVGLGITVREVPLQLDDLDDADEVFITSSTRGLMPVRQVGEHLFSLPGALTDALAASYDASLRGA